MSEPPDVEGSALDELVLAYLDRAEHAGSGSSSSILDELCREHSEEAAALRARVEALESSGLLPVDEPADLPERIDGHRILCRLGAGGMGLVYLAEEEALGRRVALKLLRGAELFSPGSRARFAREIEAVARLGHPGIAAIYGHGTAALGGGTGEPYFTMEYVPGVGLDVLSSALAGRDARAVDGHDVRALLPAAEGAADGAPEPLPELLRGSWTRIVTRIALEGARALAHAHERGVVHRDVKPSNVLLTRAGRVVLVDFGLALLEDASRLTRSGLEVGSFAYLPPEVLSDEGADPGVRGDVYGLGLVFYELLALARAHEGGSPQGLRARVLTGSPPPLRQRRPDISADLAAVCETALARDPARRYATMHAFAADLENLLGLRPIQARPPGALERVALWARRRPAAALALGLSLVVTVGGPLGYGVMQDRARRRMAELNERLALALEDARAERERAHASAEDSREAFELFTRAGRELLVDVPHAEKAMEAFLNAALDHHEQVLARRADEPSFALEVAHARRNAGWIETRLGNADRGREHFAAAGERYAEALERARTSGAIGEPPARLESWLLSVRRREAEVHLRTGRPEAARAQLEPLVEGFGPPPPEGDAVGELLLERSAVRSTHARVLQALGRAAEAEATLVESRAELAATAARVPDRRERHDWRLRFGCTAYELGTLLGIQARTDEAIRELEDALEIFATIQAEEPDRQLAELLVGCYSNLGTMLDRKGELAAAREHYGAAIELGEALARDFPGILIHRQNLSSTLGNAGIVARRSGESEEAWVLLGRALELARELASDPGSPRDALNLASLANNLGRIALDEERIDEAGAYVEEGLARLEPLLASSPEHEQYLIVHELLLVNTAKVAIARGELAGAADGLSALRRDSRNAENLLNAADAAVEITVALHEPGREPDADPELAARCAEAAVGFLRRALELGALPPRSIAESAARYLAAAPGWDELLELEARMRVAAQKAASARGN